MILRHRQIGGNPLTKGQGFVATLVGAVGVVLIARFFWIPFFDISEEFQRPFLLIGVVVYIISCSGIVKKNNERAQLFFGGYTGVSFPAGIYLLPRLPFPLISLVLHFLFSLFNKEVGPYLGWVLEGDVSVGSIVVETFAEGMTSDGVRIRLEATLVLEVENAAIYLSQTNGDTDRSALLLAVSSQGSTRIKQRVIARHTLVQLNQADYEDEYEGVNAWITDACAFVEEFGLSLSQSPVVQVDILSEQVRDVFDAYASRVLLANNSEVYGKMFAEFRKKHPEISEEFASAAFFASIGVNSGVGINVVNIK